MEKQANLTEFEAILARDFSLEEWEHEGISLAAGRANCFSAADWQILQTTWHSRDAAWQRRFARALVGGDAQSAAPILEEMVFSADPALAIEAITALWNRFYEGGPDAIRLSEKAILKIEAIGEAHSGLMHEFILETLELAGIHPD